MGNEPIEMDISVKNINFKFFSLICIVIPIVINGAGRDWWPKKKYFYGIYFFSIPNNNNGPSSGLILEFMDFWPGLMSQSVSELMTKVFVEQL